MPEDKPVIKFNKDLVGSTEVSTAETSKLKIDSFLKPPVNKTAIENNSLFDEKNTEV